MCIPESFGMTSVYPLHVLESIVLPSARYLEANNFPLRILEPIEVAPDTWEEGIQLGGHLA